jgi:putative flippase GtrA
MMRYGLVGVIAALVHITVALVLHKLWQINPFWSNAAGVFAGFLTAYTGHINYSFNNKGSHKQRLPRYAITSLTGMILQQSGVLLLVNHWQLDYSTQALPVLMVAVTMVTFLMSKLWVFR